MKNEASEDLKAFVLMNRLQEKRMALWARGKVEGGACSACNGCFGCRALFGTWNKCWTPIGAIGIREEVDDGSL